MVVKVPFYIQVYVLYWTQLIIYPDSLGSTWSSGLSRLLRGEPQMLLLLLYFLTLSPGLRAGLWFGLCCAHRGESQSSSEACAL